MERSQICKDLTGKSIAHYGAGSHATAETLQMTDYLLKAAKSSAYFGKRVVLRNLSKVEYNGLIGILGGFVAETGRRQVTLDDKKRQLALLPKNIFSFDREGMDEEVCIYNSSRNLLNDYDRFGTTSLHEVFMSDRIDVAQFLVERNVSLDIGPVCGSTVRRLVMNPTPYGPSKMHRIIRKYLVDNEREGGNRCYGCHEIFDKLSECSRCRKAAYCTKECQRTHWRSVHKHECRLLDPVDQTK